MFLAALIGFVATSWWTCEDRDFARLAREKQAELRASVFGKSQTIVTAERPDRREFTNRSKLPWSHWREPLTPTSDLRMEDLKP